MERVTKHGHNPCVYCEYRCKWAETFRDDEEPCETVKGYYRALEIEDILGDDYDLDRLRELVKADRDGRCVVLPCKKGAVLPRYGREYKADHWNVVLTAFADDETAPTGKLLELFSVEAAEAALKGGQHGKDL